MKSLLKPIIVLTVITLVCTAALAGVNSLTKEIIAASAAEKKAQSMQALFPEEQGFEAVEVSVELLKKYGASAVSKAASGAGYIVENSASGYGGEILMMVAFSEKGEVIGVKILSHEETSGIGTRVVESDDFLSQFEGKDSKTEAGIDAVSGATVSSTAVVNGINNACNLFNEAVLAQGGESK
ncbi:MAG: RnfABCDGE type electron transport complex subunit G [Oscillospiraceae bacterium]|nr:RnfABCDGE type electron transport complex subunit G [Oscillospiraceae bacterium]